MKTVFISSFKYNKTHHPLDPRYVENEIPNIYEIVSDNYNVLLSDTEEILQAYFYLHNYSNVTIYHYGPKCLSNIYDWPTQELLLERNVSKSYINYLKDDLMIKNCDKAFFFWDYGQDKINIFKVLSLGKECLVYIGSEKRFIKIKKHEDMRLLFK